MCRNGNGFRRRPSLFSLSRQEQIAALQKPFITVETEPSDYDEAVLGRDFRHPGRKGPA